ncbi:MAG: hypothetical protein FWF91_01140, partial [Coriobacteriia bacterium]|nr:hypothetical protein [Coriobacteriia bacterium]
ATMDRLSTLPPEEALEYFKEGYEWGGETLKSITKDGVTYYEFYPGEEPFSVEEFIAFTIRYAELGNEERAAIFEEAGYDWHIDEIVGTVVSDDPSAEIYLIRFLRGL